MDLVGSKASGEEREAEPRRGEAAEGGGDEAKRIAADRRRGFGEPNKSWLLLGSMFPIFAYCGLVGNPFLTAKI